MRRRGIKHTRCLTLSLPSFPPLAQSDKRQAARRHTTNRGRGGGEEFQYRESTLRKIYFYSSDRDAILQLIEGVASQISATASNKLFFLLDYSLTHREEGGEESKKEEGKVHD